jgi:hypothetical protein
VAECLDLLIEADVPEGGATLMGRLRKLLRLKTPSPQSV